MEINAERLRQHYSTMDTEALIELQRMGKKHLTEPAWVVLNEVLKSRGVADEMGAAPTEQLEESTLQSTEKNWFTRKRLFGLSFSAMLTLVLVYMVGGVIRNEIRQTKTNRTYLKELIENGYIEKAAVAYLNTLKKARTGNITTDVVGSNISEVEWKKIEKGLSECVAKEANSYLVSDDPYLNAQANKETPGILAERFVKPCVAP